MADEEKKEAQKEPQAQDQPDSAQESQAGADKSGFGLYMWLIMSAVMVASAPPRLWPTQ